MTDKEIAEIRERVKNCQPRRTCENCKHHDYEYDDLNCHKCEIGDLVDDPESECCESFIYDDHAQVRVDALALLDEIDRLKARNVPSERKPNPDLKPPKYMTIKEGYEPMFLKRMEARRRLKTTKTETSEK